GKKGPGVRVSFPPPVSLANFRSRQKAPLGSAVTGTDRRKPLQLWRGSQKVGGREARDRPRAPLRSSQVRPAATSGCRGIPAGVLGLPEAVIREAYWHEVTCPIWPLALSSLGARP